MAAPQKGTSILDQFPPEIFDEIGSNLTGRELDGVTRSSKRLRALFLRSMFHTIRFDHLQPAVRDRLRRFINHQTPEKMTEIWTAVRYVPSRSSQCPEMGALGELATHWAGLFAAVLIHNSSPNKLKAIDLSGIHSFLLSVDAQRHCKKLERLRAEHPFPPLTTACCPSIQHVYGIPSLKWLSLVEKNHGREGNIDAFGQSLEQMIEALRQMPCLVRFALTIHINRFQPDTIRDRLGLDENGDEPLTDNEVLWWYTAQVQRIADAVPQLEEVCVFGDFGTSMGVDIAGIYRGTKVKEGKTMRVLLDLSPLVGSYSLYIQVPAPDIRDRLGLDDNDNEHLTEDQTLEYYATQIRRIADAPPQLQEVCLFGNFGTSMGTEIARVYRGMKAEDGTSMRVLLDAVQPGVQCSSFPWGLNDDENS
ncbi:hypothetical protein NCS52_00011100 [Fusarium sp. LHS14.1]|nr:hypothetical protein NCS52_00011100 [Fusarium sp. LHS14.1]